MTTEAELIAATPEPRTTASLVRDLRELGVVDGGVLLAHTSLSSLGWVSGGAHAVVDALLAAVGPKGTVVVPTQSGDRSDPADWSRPPLPPDWVQAVRDSLPAYDASRTPTRSMGAVPELLRTWPGASRSAHPQVSFAAIGPDAQRIVGEHPLTPSLGEASPLARIYELDGQVLLLGVDHSSNTSFHLAEYRAAIRPVGPNRAPMLVDGDVRWVEWQDLEIDASEFARLGHDFDATGAVRIGRVGSASARLMRQRAAVDFAVEWLR
jgi:aminoglycoside 3-N-acetyltransferase